MPLVGDGITDDYAALQAAINSAAGGDKVVLPPHSTFRVLINAATPERGVSVKEGVTVDLNGSRINFECDGTVYGFRPRNGSRIVGNGRIALMASTGLTNPQGIYHAPIALGAAYDEVTNFVDPGPYLLAGDWRISDVELSTVKANGLHISGVGGVHHGVISDVCIIGGAAAVGGVNFDWGTIGIQGTIPQNRANWPASFYTVHPNNISIIRPKIGSLTNPSAEAIRLSGCRGISISDPYVKFAGTSGFSHYGGDYGFEFCHPALPRWAAYQNTALRGLTVEGLGPYGSAFKLDAWGDNIAREPGYTPLSSPIWPSNILIDGVFALGANTGVGMKIGSIAGGVIQRLRFMGFGTGADFQPGITRLQWRDSVVHGADASAVQYTGSAAGVNISNVIFEN